MSIATRSTVSKSWDQHKCSCSDEWIKKMWSIHRMECYLGIKKIKIMPFAGK